MLLLTGPAGCGKTASLCVLATEMEFMILEWVNPVSDSRETFHEGRKRQVTARVLFARFVCVCVCVVKRLQLVHARTYGSKAYLGT